MAVELGYGLPPSDNDVTSELLATFRANKPSKKTLKDYAKQAAQVGSETWRKAKAPTALFLALSGSYYGSQVSAGLFESLQHPVPIGVVSEDLCDGNRPTADEGQKSAANPNSVPDSQKVFINPQAEAQKNAPEATLLTGDNFTPEDLVILKDPEILADDYVHKRVLLIPVGYAATSEEELKKNLEDMAETYAVLPSRMRPEIAYLKRSADVAYDYVKTDRGGNMPRLTNWRQAHAIRKAVKPHYQADLVVIPYKPVTDDENKDMGSEFLYPFFPGIGDVYTIVSGEDDGDRDAGLIHAMGHALAGLFDDYTHERVIAWYEGFAFSGMIDPLKPPFYHNTLAIAKTDKNKFPIGKLPNTCGTGWTGRHLLEVNPGEPNIMRDHWNDTQLREHAANNTIFTPIQQELIERRLQKKPKPEKRGYPDQRAVIFQQQPRRRSSR